jgi:hypothetical protein
MRHHRATVIIRRRLAQVASFLALAVAVLLLPAGAAASGDVPLDLEPHIPLLYGPALSVFNIYWDTDWPADSRADVDAASKALIESEYFAGARQYGVPGIRWAGSAVANPLCGSQPPEVVNTFAIASFLQCEEAPGSGVPAAGGIPGPIPFSYGNSTGTIVYNIVLPPGVRAQIVPGDPSTITCNGEGTPAAYHFITSSNLRWGRLGGRPLYFAVIPAECAGADVQRLMSLISHEDVEVMTDPSPLAHWFDDSSVTAPTNPPRNPLDALKRLLGRGEAADICETYDEFTQMPYRADGIRMLVGTYWSNESNACVASAFRVIKATFRIAQPGPSAAMVTVDPPGDALLATPDGVSQAVLDGTVFSFESRIGITPDERWQRSFDMSNECGGLVLFPADDPGEATAQTTKTCRYSHQYRVQFEATGLPDGTLWNVTVNGVTYAGPARDVWIDDGTTASFASGTVDGFAMTGTSSESPVVVSGPLTVSATYAPATTYPGVELGDHPVGYWRLGETTGTTAFDASPNVGDGTYFNGVALGVPGALLHDGDTAALFDGVNDYVDIPNSSPLDITRSALTVELWAKAAPQRVYSTLLSKTDLNGTMGYSIYAGATGRLRFWIGGPFRFTSDFPFTWDNQWHQIVGVYDGLQLRLYVDGVAKVGTAATGPIGDSATRPLRLGQFSGGGFPYTGALDEVAVYDYPLTSAQIRAHYNQAIFGSTSGP